MEEWLGLYTVFFLIWYTILHIFSDCCKGESLWGELLPQVSYSLISHLPPGRHANTKNLGLEAAGVKTNVGWELIKLPHSHIEFCIAFEPIFILKLVSDKYRTDGLLLMISKTPLPRALTLLVSELRFIYGGTTFRSRLCLIVQVTLSAASSFSPLLLLLLADSSGGISNSLLHFNIFLRNIGIVSSVMVWIRLEQPFFFIIILIST